MPITVVRRGLLVLLVVTLIAGCSSSSGADDAATLARSIVIQPGELPGGWRGSPHDTAADDYTKTAVAFNTCLGRSTPLRPSDGVTAQSEDFSEAGGASQVKSAATLIDAKRARAAVDGFARDASPRCLTDALRPIIAKATGADVEVTGLDSAPLPLALGIHTIAALRTTLRLKVKGVDLVVYLDNVLIAEGPWFGRLSLVGTSTPLDPALRDRLLRAMDRRMVAAAA